MLIATAAGCKKPEAIVCNAPVNPTCPGVAPSFANDVFPNVFIPYCTSCHSPDGGEAKTPLQTYQQIYGSNGAGAHAIFQQVFESCLMPPSNAPSQLLDGDGGDALGPRQTLLDWLVCQAPDN